MSVLPPRDLQFVPENRSAVRSWSPRRKLVQRRAAAGKRVYYETRLHQDLRGNWVVTRVWGRRGTAWGQVRRLPCGSYAEGLEMLTAIAMRRRQRGYVVVENAREMSKLIR